MVNIEVREPSKQVIEVKENSTSQQGGAINVVNVIEIVVPGPKGLSGERGPEGPAGPIDMTGRSRANHTGTQSLDTTTDSFTRFALTTNERSLLSGATSSPTASTLAIRDAAGKVSFNAVYSTAAQDTSATALTRKDYVDTKMSLTTHNETVSGNKTFSSAISFTGPFTWAKAGADQVNGMEAIMNGENSSLIVSNVFGFVKRFGQGPALGYSSNADFLVHEYATITALRDFPRNAFTQRMKITRGTGEVDFSSAVLRIANKQVATSEEVTNAAATKVSHTQTYTANGAKSGFHLDLSLDYDTTVVTLNEPIMVKAKTDTTALTRAFWLNESGAPRAAAVKQDPAARFYGPPTDSPNTVVLDIHSSDKVAGRGPRWGIDVTGRPRLGPNREIGSNLLVLAAGAAVPTDIPVGTVIMRTS